MLRSYLLSGYSAGLSERSLTVGTTGVFAVSRQIKQLNDSPLQGDPFPLARNGRTGLLT